MIVARAEVADGRLAITLRRDVLPGADKIRDLLAIETDLAPSQAGRSKPIVPIVLGAPGDRPTRDPEPIALVAYARRWSAMLLSGKTETVEAITRQEGLGKGVVSRVLPLAHLAPDIAAAIRRA